MTFYDEFSTPREQAELSPDREFSPPALPPPPPDEFSVPAGSGMAPLPGEHAAAAETGSVPPAAGSTPVRTRRRTSLLYMVLAALMTVVSVSGVSLPVTHTSGGVNAAYVLPAVCTWVSDDGECFIRFEADGNGWYHYRENYFIFTWEPEEERPDMVRFSGSAHFVDGSVLAARASSSSHGWFMHHMTIDVAARGSSWTFDIPRIFMEHSGDEVPHVSFSPSPSQVETPSHVRALYGKTGEEVLTMADWEYVSGTDDLERQTVYTRVDDMSFQADTLTGNVSLWVDGRMVDRQPFLARYQPDDHEFYKDWDIPPVMRDFRFAAPEDIILTDPSTGFSEALRTTYVDETGATIFSGYLEELITDEGVFLRVSSLSGTHCFLAPKGGVLAPSSQPVFPSSQPVSPPYGDTEGVTGSTLGHYASGVGTWRAEDGSGWLHLDPDGTGWWYDGTCYSAIPEWSEDSLGVTCIFQLAHIYSDPDSDPIFTTAESSNPHLRFYAIGPDGSYEKDPDKWVGKLAWNGGGPTGSDAYLVPDYSFQPPDRVLSLLATDPMELLMSTTRVPVAVQPDGSTAFTPGARYRYFRPDTGTIDLYLVDSDGQIADQAILSVSLPVQPSDQLTTYFWFTPTDRLEMSCFWGSSGPVYSWDPDAPIIGTLLITDSGPRLAIMDGTWDQTSDSNLNSGVWYYYFLMEPGSPS